MEGVLNGVSGGVYYEATFSLPKLDPSKELWVETRSPAGKVYFYSAKTRKTAWTKPAQAQVISQQQFLTLALANAPQQQAMKGKVQVVSS